MAGASEKYIKNAALATPVLNIPQGNAPGQYDSLEHQYLAQRSKMFAAKRAYLSSDYVEAEVQGLTDDFYTFTKTKLRLSDVTNITAAGTKNADDYKLILLSELGIDYFPIGAKVITMGSVWICVNPGNMSSAMTDALIVRCNTSYNSYDNYGNVITEPIYVTHDYMLGNSNDPAKNLVMMDGSFDVVCQLNDNTARLGQNKRLILGTKAYNITGYTDFIQEFTGDRESVHLLRFTARVEEPTINDDVTENFIADGNLRSFAIKVDGATEMTVGQMAQITAHFVRDGETVLPDEDNPITWEFESSDESILGVSGDTVTARAAGAVMLSARMAQNPSLGASLAVYVNEGESGTYVAFSKPVSSEIKQYTADIFTAFVYIDGQKTDLPLEWEFSGAEKENYAATVDDDGLSASVYCISAASAPLTITARYENASATISVALLGY